MLLYVITATSVFSPSVEWRGLVDAMSGLLGAHLNAIDSASSFQPRYSFRPHGPIFGKHVV